MIAVKILTFSFFKKTNQNEYKFSQKHAKYTINNLGKILAIFSISGILVTNWSKDALFWVLKF